MPLSLKFITLNGKTRTIWQKSSFDIWDDFDLIRWHGVQMQRREKT